MASKEWFGAAGRCRCTSLTRLLLCMAILVGGSAFSTNPLTVTKKSSNFRTDGRSIPRQNGQDPAPLSGPVWTESRLFDTKISEASSTLKTTTAGEISVPSETEEDVYKTAILTTLGWVGAAAVFGTFLYFTSGATASEEFFAGYLVEQSLSVDNIFVFLLLFEYFNVPLSYQNRALRWGIAGAVVMRGITIGIGAAALKNFRELLLVFAAVLVYSSGKILIGTEDDEEEDPSENAIVKFASNLYSSTAYFDGDKFFTMEDGIKKATPLFICMIALELSDVVFAVDSIPAVFGVTENPMIVFTSNMFAIMGLRSLYVILSKAASDLKYLEPAVAVVLGFIGVKLIAEYFGYCIATPVALGVVASMLGTGIFASILEKREISQ